MRLACRLRDLRQARGLSIREVERETGIARAYLSWLERGWMLPRDEWRGELERVYGAPVSAWYAPPAGAVAGVAIELDAN